MKVSFKTVGLRELAENITELKLATQRGVVRVMTNAAALVVQRDAKQRAPKSEKAHKVFGTKVVPGNLRKNIIVKRLQKPPKGMASAHIVTVRGGKSHGFASFYGSMVEHGTVKMSARPFLRPALESNTGKALEAMKTSGAKRLAQVQLKASQKGKRA